MEQQSPTAKTEKVVQVEKEIDEYREKVAAQEKEVATLKGELATLKGELAELKGRLAAKEDGVSKSDVDQMVSLVLSAEANKSTAQSLLVELMRGLHLREELARETAKEAAQAALVARAALKKFVFEPQSCSSFVASSGTELSPCCVAGVPLPCAVPAVAQALLQPSNRSSADVRALLQRAMAQPPDSLAKVSETGVGQTVSRLVIPALRQTLVGESVYLQLLGTVGAEVPFAEYCPKGLASSGSRSEGPFVVVDLKIPVAFVEAKNTSFSPLEQLGQAFAAASNGLARQLEWGLPRERCVVLVVATNSMLYQFGCATWLAPCLPHFLVLTLPLNASDERAAEWLLRFSTFMEAKAREIVALEQSGGRVPCKLPDKMFNLDMERYHLKAADCVVKQLSEEERSAAAWLQYLQVFCSLWEHEELRERVVFPIGFLRGAPSKKADKKSGKLEGVLFDRLSDEWRLGVPADAAERAAFVEALLRFVRAMHGGARLVHMDLMPCNVAWRGVAGGALELRVLDFDTASRLDGPLPHFSTKNAASATNPHVQDIIWKRMKGMEGDVDARYDLWFCYVFEQLKDGDCVSCCINDEGAVHRVLEPFFAAVRRMRKELDEGFEPWLISKQLAAVKLNQEK